MGFSLKGFAGGLADSATDYYKDQNDSRDTKKKDTRNLIFKAHEQVYSDAKEAQKVNQAQIKLDTAYISGVESMDPTISDDNKSKLLSLTPEKRQQAEDELLYRQVADPSATFSSFMSYVEEPEDLDDMERVDQRATDSLIAVPNPAEPYYDKTGLVADSTIDTMYSKVAGVLTDAHGFSPEKAREIIKQAAQEVEYPPIAIDWSERAFLKQASTERIIEENALIITRNDAALAGLTKTNIDLAADATSGAIDLFASNYMRQTMDEDGDLEWLDAGKTKPKLVQVLMQQAKDDPEFTNRFRKSKAYKQLALDSASSYIMDMVTNPKKKRNSMAYLNGAFPGMYKGEIDVSTAEGIEKAKGVDVNKIYFLKANPNNTSTPQGGVYMGSQILAGLKQQGLITEGTDEEQITDETEQANASQLDSVSENVESMKEQGVTLQELGFTTWEEAENSMANAEIVNKEDRLQQGQGFESLTTYEDNIKRMNSEMRTATGSYRKYLLRELGDSYIKDYKETKVTPLRELTDYQKVMIDEKRGTIGAAKAYDQALDIAIRNGDIDAIRNIQSILLGLADDQIGLGVSDMIDELTKKIESALNG